MSDTTVGLAICTLLIALGLVLIASAGARPALLSAPMWWSFAAIAYTIVPTILGTVGESTTAPLTVLVTNAAITEYLIYVGLVTFAFCLGWRLVTPNQLEGGNGLFNTTVDIPFGRAAFLLALGLALKISSAILSGIEPIKMLTTVSGAGYGFHGAGEFRFSFLNVLGTPLMTMSAALLVYAARSAGSLRKKVAATVWFGVALTWAILSGVRLNVFLFMITVGLVFVIHPRRYGRNIVRRGRLWVTVTIGAALLYPLALWMQYSRANSELDAAAVLDSDGFGGFLDMVTPSAALFDWVRSFGHVPGVSITDALIQAPPSFIAPNTGRAEFLQIVDSMNVGGAGAAVTSPAELYLNAGWVVGPLFMLVVGVLTAWVQHRVTARNSIFCLIVAMTLGPAFAYIFTRGYLWQALVAVGLVPIVALGISIFLGKDRGSPLVEGSSTTQPQLVASNRERVGE